MVTRIAFQSAMRAAAVQLLTDFRTAADIKLQIYPGRPRSVNPPTAFVDLIRESIEYSGPTFRRRVPTAEVIVIHGIFDSADAADQKDAFVDEFLDYVTDRFHAAGANTLIAVTSTEDIPDYVPEWLPPAEQKTYYATRVSMEGLAIG